MRKGTCKYFNGAYHNITCAAGVQYADVTPNPELPGSGLRLPCHTEMTEHRAQVLKTHGPAGVCAQYEEPTAEDLAAHEADVERMMARTEKMIPLVLEIKGQHKGTSIAGQAVCPICGGVLKWRHVAANGHVWAFCQTPGCVQWME